MQSPSGEDKKGSVNPNRKERNSANWRDGRPSAPYGKGDVRKDVGWCLTVMDGGISNRLCVPFVAVGAMCCVRAFRDGSLARIADIRETSPRLHLYQAASLDCCVAALMVLERVLSIEPTSTAK